jgi:uncharacterized protein
MSNAEIRGRFVWHELMTTDTDAAIDFYSHVVPWKTQDSGMPSYTLWMSGKFRAGGLMALPEDGPSGTPPHWLVYVGTPDVDETVESAEKLGGKVLKPASDIPNVGRFAVLSDPQGATFAVYTPAPPSGDEVPPGGGVGDFTWHELATTDLEGALNFYSELFGWSKGAAHEMGEMGTYQLISLGGQDIGGIYKARDNSSPPSWLSYARVPDATKAANAVKANGGRILNGPMEVPGGSWIVMMHDPQGGAFAIVEAPRAAKGGSAADKAAAAPKKAAKKAPAKKAPAKKAAAAAAKGAPAKMAPAKKTAAKKGAAKKSVAKKAAKKVAKKAPVRAAAKKSTTAKRGSAPKKATKAKRKK